MRTLTWTQDGRERTVTRSRPECAALAGYLERTFGIVARWAA